MPSAKISSVPSNPPETPADSDDEIDNVTLDIQNAENSIRILRPQLEDAKKRLNVHMGKYNDVRRYLAIVLDSRLLHLSVLGNSLLRHALNENAHLPNDINDPDFQAALAETREIVMKYARAHNRMDEAKLYEADIHFDVQRLSKLVYTPNDYFGEHDMLLEKIVDTHLTSLNNNATENGHWGDLRLLMSWLESVKPSNVQSTRQPKA